MKEQEEIIIPDFNFWFPAEIEKANGTKLDLDNIDKDNMFLKGIASDESWDADGQSLKTDGLDLDYLLQRGFCNWHHVSKTNPSAIIGEPVEARIIEKPKPGLFIKAKLYNTPTAIDAYKIAMILEQQSKTRRLGWSIEGKILEKDYDNVVHKAKLTGVALTPSPKNSNTFADVCKAFGNGESTEQLLIKSQDNFRERSNRSKLIINTSTGRFNILEDGTFEFTEKALTVDSGAPLRTEDLEGSPNHPNMNLILKSILQKYPEITFEKALKIAHKVLDNRK